MAGNWSTPEQIITKLRLGRGADSIGQAGGQGRPRDLGDGADLLSLVIGVRRAEARPDEATEAVVGGERTASEGAGGLGAGERHLEGRRLGKLLSAARRRACVEHVTIKLSILERFACRVMG